MIVKTLQNYNDLYAESINDSNTFWSNIANRIDWHSKWDNVSKVDYDKDKIKWFIGGKLYA